MADAKISTQLSKIISFFGTIQNTYNQSHADVARLDDLTQDYLHKLEFADNLSDEEYAKIGLEIAKCRKERRIAKDLTEVLKPLLDLTEQGVVVKSVNLMKETLGTVRKIEDRHSGRQYGNRVLVEDNDANAAEEGA